MQFQYEGGWVSLSQLARDSGFKSGMTDKLREVIKRLEADGLERKLMRPLTIEGAQLCPAGAWCVAPGDVEYVMHAFREYKDTTSKKRSQAARERFSGKPTESDELPQPKGRAPQPIPEGPTVTKVHQKCGITECYNPVRALGLCVTHWQQQHLAKGKPNALHEKRAAYAGDITKYAVLEGYKIVYENLVNALRQIEQKIQENT